MSPPIHDAPGVAYLPIIWQHFDTIMPWNTLRIGQNDKVVPFINLSHKKGADGDFAAAPYLLC